MKYNFKGFTSKANDALNSAISSAEFLGHTYVGSEHLLLGLLKIGSGVAFAVLNKNGVKLALASGSSMESISHHLKEVGATKFFDVIVPGTAVTNGKPAPDIFLLAAQKLGVNPKNCYVLEDSENGIIAAYKAGMKCIGIPDVVEFNSETKTLLTAEFRDMTQALPFFEKML